jgi:DNA-binding response OmpR family regulator
MRILLVDSDARFSRMLSTALRRCGYDVEQRWSAAEAVRPATCDLVLLDADLPDGDGVATCRELRRGSDVGVIMLSGRTDEPSRVAGLRAGADDFVQKPFGFVELQARIEAVLRRRRPHAVGVHRVGRLVVDRSGHRAYLDGEPLALTRKEFQLLAALASDTTTVHRRERLLMEVWQTSWRGTSRTLDVHVATLRAKLAPAGVQVETVRGVGHRLVACDAEPGHRAASTGRDTTATVPA